MTIVLLEQRLYLNVNDRGNHIFLCTCFSNTCSSPIFSKFLVCQIEKTILKRDPIVELIWCSFSDIEIQVNCHNAQVRKITSLRLNIEVQGFKITFMKPY